MLKAVFFCVLFAFCFSVLAGPDPDDTVLNEVTAPPIIKPVWDINDSLNLIPAFDLYCDFDQQKIWKQHEDLTKIENDIDLKVTHDSCDFHAPVTGRLTSGYGWRGSRPHYGVDIKLATGDSVKGAFEGMVRISQYSRTYGNVIVLRHSNGLETLYAHLSKRLVSEGDFIEQGAVIGLGGNTGRSFGSHLHFETRLMGEPIDPADFFEITDSSFFVKADSLKLTAANFNFLKEVRRIKYHRVRSGDSLWRISRRYGVSISKLCRLNKVSRKSTLKIGQRIRYN